MTVLLVTALTLVTLWAVRAAGLRIVNRLRARTLVLPDRVEWR